MINIILFLSKLYMADVLFVYNAKRRKHFIVRIIIGVIVAHFVQYGYGCLLGLLPSVPTVLYLSIFFLGTLLTIFVMWLSFDIPFSKALIYGTGGYVIQNVAYYIRIIFINLTGLRFTGAFNEFMTYVYYTVVYAAFFIWIYLMRKRYNEENFNKVSVFIISIATMLFAVVMSSQIPFNKGTDILILFSLYSVFGGITLIAIQLGLFQRSALAQERDIVERMLRIERKQQKISKDSIDFFNIKYHDIKKQLNTLSNDESKITKENIDELKSNISLYDCIVHTGNDALDIILTEKRLFCEQHGIRLACMADGEKLNFMKASDIYSLFGNILDNAIESVIKMPDSSKQFINLNIIPHGSLLLVHVENYCTVIPEFVDGLPKTTKGDENYHGYGIKSIKFIVEKYNGNLILDIKDGLFITDISFKFR